MNISTSYPHENKIFNRLNILNLLISRCIQYSLVFDLNRELEASSIRVKNMKRNE